LAAHWSLHLSRASSSIPNSYSAKTSWWAYITHCPSWIPSWKSPMLWVYRPNLHSPYLTVSHMKSVSQPRLCRNRHPRTSICKLLLFHHSLERRSLHNPQLLMFKMPSNSYIGIEPHGTCFVSPIWWPKSRMQSRWTWRTRRRSMRRGEPRILLPRWWGAIGLKSCWFWVGQPAYRTLGRICWFSWFSEL